MSGGTVRQMLGEYFAIDFVDNAIEKKWFGGYEIRVLSVVYAELGVFQKGAILGRAKADKMNMLAKLVAEEGKEDNMCDYFRESAERSLNEYGKEPGSFHDFFMKIRYPSIDLYNIKMLKTLSKKKFRFGEIISNFQVDTVLGIGFGVINPELVKKMWVKDYETEKDPKIWEDARKHGLDLPEKQSYLPLKEMEQIVLLQVYEFAKENKPDLITPLGLK